jgi:hypothetical protein
MGSCFMRLVLPGAVTRTGLAGILCGAILAASCSGAVAQQKWPRWSYGWQELKIDFQECMARATLAFKAQNMPIRRTGEGATIASKEVHLGSIMCTRLSDQDVYVHMVVASNAENSPATAALRVALQAEMDKSSCRPTPWGFQYCYGREQRK